MYLKALYSESYHQVVEVFQVFLFGVKLLEDLLDTLQQSPYCYYFFLGR